MHHHGESARRTGSLGSVSAATLGLLLAATSLGRGDEVRFRDEQTGEAVTLRGNVLVQDSVGAILLEAPDTQRYILAPSDILEWQRSAQRVPFYTRTQLMASLRNEFRGDFRLLRSENYLVVHESDVGFAKETARLLEQTHAAFSSALRTSGGYRFDTLYQPLVAVVYADRESYQEAITARWSDVGWSQGLYSEMTNRVYLYDPRSRRGRLDPTPDRLDGTVVHEAVHQLGYNLGVHDRQTRVPAWLTEGLATYFEPLAYDAGAKWTSKAPANKVRLFTLAQDWNSLEDGFLDRLVTDDAAIRRGSVEAYAQAWGLTFYLMRSRPRPFLRYVRDVREHARQAYDADARREDFRKAFGMTPDRLEGVFERYYAPAVGKISASVAASRGR